MVNTLTLVSAYIESKHGWAVAGQFQGTFYGEESFAEKNWNALQLIRKDVQELLDSDMLGDLAYEELSDYKAALEDHIAMMKA